MTDIFFAVANYYGINNATFGRWDWKAQPLNILCAYPFLNQWWKRDFQTPGIRTMLDSGAYSAWGSGLVIDMNELCEEAAKPEWDEVVALDVIGDAEASLRNALEMKKRGLNVIPVLHFGEPWYILDEYAREFERIGLASGHGAKFAERMRWTEQCFARVYPKHFHSFGWVDERPLMAFPFRTADTASWHASTRYGRLSSAPDIRAPKTSELGRPTNDLRSEIAYYLGIQQRVKERWSSELAKLESQVSLELRRNSMSENENNISPIDGDAEIHELVVEPVGGSEDTGGEPVQQAAATTKASSKKGSKKSGGASKKRGSSKKAPASAAPEKTGVIESGKPETGESGVKMPTRPGEGTSTGKVWTVADSLVENNTAPSRKAVIEKAVAAGVNKATAGVQYKRWLDAFVAGGGQKHTAPVAEQTPEVAAEPAVE